MVEDTSESDYEKKIFKMKEVIIEKPQEIEEIECLNKSDEGERHEDKGGEYKEIKEDEIDGKLEDEISKIETSKSDDETFCETNEDQSSNKEKLNLKLPKDGEILDNSNERHTEEDYDPEILFNKKKQDELNVTFTGEYKNEENTEGKRNFSKDDKEPLVEQDKFVEENDDEYDPEVNFMKENDTSDKTNTNFNFSISEPTSVKAKVPLGLPPKPHLNSSMKNISATNDLCIFSNTQKILKEAYNAILQNESLTNYDFLKLTESEQTKIIMKHLSEKKINLDSGLIVINPNINYDQVYSYNKPFKNLKEPIPLIPVNEFCRRPNITAPMLPEEEEAYAEFIKNEAHYMSLLNCEEFPDNLRLFIGNLPANTISKQDLFRIFSKYGSVIQIAIKAGYGFVQFRTAESCFDCIKGETNVPLHNKIMRLDASKPQRTKKNSRFEINNSIMNLRGRDRSFDDGCNKKRKFQCDCQVYITGKSSVFFIRKVKKAFLAAQINIDTEDITHKDITKVINDAAYSGVLGTCVIKELKVDVQTFESSLYGGIKFDEYADIDPEIAANILLKAKQKKYGTNFNSYYISNSSNNDNHNVIMSLNPNDNHYNNFLSYNRKRNNVINKVGSKRVNLNNRNHQLNQNLNIQNKLLYNNKNFPQPYGQPPQFNSTNPFTNEQPLIQNLSNDFQSKNFNQYNHFSEGNNIKDNLIEKLQSLDPESMKNIISILNKKVQHSHEPVNLSQFNQDNFNYQYDNTSYNHDNNTDQVNTLLNQLKSTFSFNSYQNQYQNSESTHSLMDTLSRLTRK